MNDVKEMKVLKILSAIVLGTQIFAVVALVGGMLNEKLIYKLYTGRPEMYEGVFVVPWSTIITVFSNICFAVLLFIFVRKFDGKALKVSGIILAATKLANGLTSTVQTLTESRLAAEKGNTYLAALSSVNSFLSMIISPMNAIGMTLFTFVCGMCVLVKYNKSDKMVR